MTVTLKCEICGALFVPPPLTPGHRHGSWCSSECVEEWKRRSRADGFEPLTAETAVTVAAELGISRGQS